MSAPGADGAQIDGAQIEGGAEPESPPAWLGPIQDRMEELHEQSAQMADQLAALSGDGYEDYADDDGYALTEDDLNEEDYAAFEDEFGDDIDTLNRAIDADVIDLVTDGVDRAVSRREAQVDADAAIDQRNEDFDALVEAMPLLQNERLAREIVQIAQAKANRWDPSLIDKPEFVQLVESEALAYIGRQAREQQAAGSAQPDVLLESASGAVPQQTTTDDDYWGDRVLAAAERLHPKI